MVSIHAVAGKGLAVWLKQYLLTCPIKQLSGVDCPGCGLQRSVLALLDGNVYQSFQLYPATLPLIGLAVFTFIHLKFDLRNGARFIKILYTSVSLIILVHYFYKIFTHQLH